MHKRLLVLSPDSQTVKPLNFRSKSLPGRLLIVKTRIIATRDVGSAAKARSFISEYSLSTFSITERKKFCLVHLQSFICKSVCSMAARSGKDVAVGLLSFKNPWIKTITEHRFVGKNPAFIAFIEIVENTKNLTKADIKDIFYNFPEHYQKWWNHLYRDAPIHILIETTMIVFILWLTFIRKTADPKKKSTEDVKFNKKEVEWLVNSWEPEPLVPELTPDQQILNSNRVVVEGVSGINNGYLNIEGQSQHVLNMSSYDFLGLSSAPSVTKATEDALEQYGCGSCGPR